jgi:hypothetical protein
MKTPKFSFLGCFHLIYQKLKEDPINVYKLPYKQDFELSW